MKALGPSSTWILSQVATVCLGGDTGPRLPKNDPSGTATRGAKNRFFFSKFLETDGDSKEMFGDIK